VCRNFGSYLKANTQATIDTRSIRAHRDSMSDSGDTEVIAKKKGRPVGSKTRKAVVAQQKVAKVLDLKARGLSVAEICGAVGLKDTRVKDILRQFKPIFTELENNEAYQNVRRDLLSATELLLLKSLNDPEKLAKSTLNGTAYAFKQVFDARRLESNLSTSNVATQKVEVSLSAEQFNMTDN
jgi:hypothetical protein